MQLPRVVIAAVFFVIGALIAIPALVRATGESSASSSPAASTTSPSLTGTGATDSPTPTGTRTGRTSPTPTPTTSPTRTRTTATPAPAQPLNVSIGSVDCPDREVEVTVRNTGTSAEDYAIERNDGSAAVAGRLGPGASRTATITLRENRRTRIEVTRRNEPVESQTLTANCRRASPEPTPTRNKELPRTGSESTVLWARAATGAAAMVTGAIIFWYGGIWPRRRDQMFAKKGGE
jgi:cytoskeletal protein RodZ